MLNGYRGPAPWSECVIVGAKGGPRFVSTSADALALLESDWPSRDYSYDFALSACREAVRNHEPAYVARRAFAEAAERAGLLRA